MRQVVVAVAVFGWSLSLLAAEVKITRILEQHTFQRPLGLVTPPDDSPRQFLVEQTGKIKVLCKDAEPGIEPPVFLDLTDRGMEHNEFEEGLFALAFHPKFAENGKFYITYTQQGPKRTVLSEFQVSADDPNQADPTTERILLEIQQPDWNHNSGILLFDPKDGLLYMTVGDGGLRNGAFSLPQKLHCLFGKLLRIDVDSRTGNLPYGIPADNPFLDVPRACPEIYALGLRNPWGMHIDSETGTFWLADVGQNLWEEVNIVEKGANYGWEFREGTHRFFERDRFVESLGYNSTEPPANVVFTEPVWEYDRTQGFSITGGFVYRGSQMPELQGYYLVGDWKMGNVWGLKYDCDQKKVVDVKEVIRPKLEDNINITAIAPDLDGEIILTSWHGPIYRLEPES